LCYVLFVLGLGDIGLIGPDEPRYAAIAREMLASGDYITPRLYGVPWFEKPPLMYWLAALGYKLFGINEFGARFPSALGATLCVIAIYWCGRNLWDRFVGFWAAWLLASALIYPFSGWLLAQLVSKPAIRKEAIHKPKITFIFFSRYSLNLR
jgi:4-amino-4-deoxy-L-arabinose transferase-like glycosyltransferase